jgi:hypothetical protein
MTSVCTQYFGANLRPLGSHQPLVSGLHPPRDRSLILDQIDRDSRRQRLANAILRALTGLDRVMERNAQVRAGLEHL